MREEDRERREQAQTSPGMRRQPSNQALPPLPPPAEEPITNRQRGQRERRARERAERMAREVAQQVCKTNFSSMHPILTHSQPGGPAQAQMVQLAPPVPQPVNVPVNNQNHPVCSFRIQPNDSHIKLTTFQGAIN